MVGSCPRTVLRGIAAVALPLAVAMIGMAFGQESNQPAHKVGKPAARKVAKPSVAAVKNPSTGFTPEREATALGFVAQHHPELADVLDRLKDMNRGKYEQAVAEIIQANDVLARMKDRDPQRHALALESWTLRSQVNLLTARIAGNRDDDAERRLRDLLARQVEVEMAQHRIERDRLKARLDKVEAMIGRLEADREKLVESRLRRLVNLRDQRNPAISKKKGSP